MRLRWLVWAAFVLWLDFCFAFCSPICNFVETLLALRMEAGADFFGILLGFPEDAPGIHKPHRVSVLAEILREK
jgi:hypothetical protein